MSPQEWELVKQTAVNREMRGLVCLVADSARVARAGRVGKSSHPIVWSM
jgi:hypothetical protein